MKYSKTEAKEAKKQEFMEYLSSLISPDDITKTSKFKEYKSILKQNSKFYSIYDYDKL